MRCLRPLALALRANVAQRLQVHIFTNDAGRDEHQTLQRCLHIDCDAGLSRVARLVLGYGENDGSPEPRHLLGFV